LKEKKSFVFDQKWRKTSNEFFEAKKVSRIDFAFDGKLIKAPSPIVKKSLQRMEFLNCQVQSKNDLLFDCSVSD
jgi:hypothetical protein